VRVGTLVAEPAEIRVEVSRIGQTSSANIGLQRRDGRDVSCVTREVAAAAQAQIARRDVGIERVKAQCFGLKRRRGFQPGLHAKFEAVDP